MKYAKYRRNYLGEKIVVIIQKMPCYSNQQPKGKATVSENPVFYFHIFLSAMKAVQVD